MQETRDFKLGEWLVQPTSNIVRRSKEVHRLEPMLMEVLTLLASRPGATVTRDQFFEQVWAGRVVEEGVLSQGICNLRRVLGDNAKRPRYIRTVPKRGYQLLESVQVIERRGEGRSAGGLRKPGQALKRARQFVGRKKELVWLQERYRLARAGGGHSVFVTGTSGSGKSALVAEFAQNIREHASKPLVCTGRFDLHPGAEAPFVLTFRQLVTSLIGSLRLEPTSGSSRGENHGQGEPARIGPAKLIDQGHRLLRQMSSLPAESLTSVLHSTELPSTRSRPDSYGRTSPEPGQVLEQTLEELVGFLARVSAYRPLIMVLEDLHWANMASISLLIHLTHEIRRHETLLIATCRSETVAAGYQGGRHPLKCLLGELKSHDGDIELDLEKAEPSQLAGAMLDNTPWSLTRAQREHLVRKVESCTQGHALLIFELGRSLVSRPKEAALLSEDLVEDYWPTLPVRPHAMLDERLNRMPAKLLDILKLAAVQGDSFSPSLLAKAGQVPVGEMIQVIRSELDRGHLLVEAQRAAKNEMRSLPRYRFRQPIVRKFILASLDSVERSHLQAQLAENLHPLGTSPPSLTPLPNYLVAQSSRTRAGRAWAPRLRRRSS